MRPPQADGHPSIKPWIADPIKWLAGILGVVWPESSRF
jgi:hypothetical protein